MAAIEIVRAETAHIAAIAAAIRPADRFEVWAASLSTPEEALLASLAFSTLAWTGLADGAPFCMFGVCAASRLCRHGIPWLLGGTQIEANAVGFLRRSKSCLREVRQEYGILSNFVDARNLAAIRWLKWLGFTILPVQPHGPFNLPFHPFEMRS